jgi:acetyltransferase-like isoleucine patch superfamily enzyme
MKKLAIFGTGGAGREVAEWARACGFEDIVLTVDDNFFTSVEINRFLCIPFSQIAIEEYRWLVAIADSSLREVIAKKINNQAEFATLVHVFVNTQSYIGHDCVIADYVTISPCTAVLGNCKVESHVFLGANSSIKEGTSISSGTIVGMGAVVIKNLSRGVYVGNPARKIN